MNGAQPPAVSIVLPVRNRRGLLPGAIDSVLRQTFAAFELIVVDDASSDDTRAFVEGLPDSRIRYFRLDRHSGPAVARNRGIREARADLLAFQDSDDAWDPRKLERQLALLRASTGNVGLVLGAYVLNEPRGARTVRSAALERGEGYGSDLLWGEALVTPLWLARRDALERAGLFDESLRSAEDYDLSFRLARVCRFRAVPDIVLTKQGHADSLTADNALLLHGLRAAMARYPEAWSPHPFSEALMLTRIAKLQQHTGAHADAARSMLRALRRQPLRPAILWRVVSHFFGRTALRTRLARLRAVLSRVPRP